MNGYYLGVDAGSASVRAGLFSSRGERLAFATRPISQFHDEGHCVEQSSDEIWTAVGEAVREAVTTSHIAPERIKGIGFDATCSLVMLGSAGEPLSVSASGDPQRNIVMWMDHRATREAEEINATEDRALQYVGGKVSVEMQLPKILWLKRHYPERYAQCARLLDLADFLVWKATGADIASVCTLTCKWNYLAHENQFSASLLSAMGLEDILARIPPVILPLGSAAGKLSPQAARAFGLPEGIAVATGIIDAHAGGLALLAGDPEGSLALIGGTSNCHMVVSREPCQVAGVWGPYWNAMLPEWWLNEGGQSAAGALVEWTIAQHEAWPALEQEAKQRGVSHWQLLNEWVSHLEQRDPFPTRALHVLPDHHGNRSPRADPLARGAVFGLTLERGRDGLARQYLATLQGIALGTRHIIDVMQQAGHHVSRLFLCGGVTRNPLWLREYANATGRTLHLAAEEDVVTLGAALLGAVASGEYADFASAARQMVRPGAVIAADAEKHSFFAAKYRVFLQMYDDQQRAAALMQYA
ncbi:FGGY-family carbohydrate kinase [Sodalis endosymbiont of Spalangia cameroni]|uniref:FGGY-family carbohydrate kinase n=1 Tax=Sodalis praecaptivus TaxID=1239307 RepID=UPI0031F9972B